MSKKRRLGNKHTEQNSVVAQAMEEGGANASISSDRMGEGADRSKLHKHIHLFAEPIHQVLLEEPKAIYITT